MSSSITSSSISSDISGSDRVGGVSNLGTAWGSGVWGFTDVRRFNGGATANLRDEARFTTCH
jgi:hypothetical protein